MIRLLAVGVSVVNCILLVEFSAWAAESSISGELRQWHKVTLTLEGPHASEDGTLNPFLDYRMQVTFVTQRPD